MQFPLWRSNMGIGSVRTPAQPLLSILPGGPATNQIANPAGLTDSRGNAVTCTRALGAYCRKSTVSDPLNFTSDPEGNNTAGWFGSNAGLTANSAAAPDGTMSAITFADTASNTTHFRGPAMASMAGALTTTSPWTFSFYAKAGTASFINAISGNNLSGAVFNLSTGVVAFTNGVSASMSASVNGWWRCVVNFGNTGAADTAYIVANATGASSAFPAYVGATSTVFIWGLKSEAGASATTYVSPMLVSIPANTARVEPEGLLVEGASTNVLIRSQEFDNGAAWSKSTCTATADQAIAPDGTLTADRLQISAGTQGVTGTFQSNSGTYSGTTQTYSVYLRCASGTVSAGLKLTYSAVADYYQDVTVTTQWQRFTITRTFATNASTTAVVGVTCAAAGGAADVYAWGAQLEAYGEATSYIPTTAGPVTRSIDNVSTTAAGNLGAAGTVKATIIPQWTGAPPIGGGVYFVQVTTGGNATLLYSAGTNSANSFVGSQFLAPTGGFTYGVPLKARLVWTGTAATLFNDTAGTSATSTFASSNTAGATVFQLAQTGGAQDPFWLKDVSLYRS